MKLAVSFVALLLLGLANPVAAGPLEDARPAAKRGDYATAVRLFEPLAEGGDATAQAYLGSAYQWGKGVPQDHAEAVKWYQKAAEQGDVTAQHGLALSYRYGWGVPRDFVQALKWCQKAAAQGSAAAENNLGQMYENGEGVRQDYAEALKIKVFGQGAIAEVSVRHL
jgi:uncharacterized protein